MPRIGERAPLAVAYGGGVDSTALLIELARRGHRPDVITFADHGGDPPWTYGYVKRFDRWLRGRGLPRITWVTRKPVERHGIVRYRTIVENMLANATLPSICYGPKKCSMSWKIDPQNKFMARWPPAVECWRRGDRVVKAIGFDAGPADCRRTYAADACDTDLYDYWYPLQDWGVDRAGCVEIIRAAGLPVPLKSSCIFCGAMKWHEVVNLALNYPDLLAIALHVEDTARANTFNPLRTVKGLGRNYAWRDRLEAEGYPVPPRRIALMRWPGPKRRRAVSLPRVEKSQLSLFEECAL